ncbi:MAG: hypothetical protein LBD15_02210 [Holosporales bacterium]|jgi:predicted membrane GTPase involved in stress response|nr:hypothetical protein [Holosporales bacterium]
MRERERKEEGENIRLTPPRPIVLEQALSYIADDELVGSDTAQYSPAQTIPRP